MKKWKIVSIVILAIGLAVGIIFYFRHLKKSALIKSIMAKSTAMTKLQLNAMSLKDLQTLYNGLNPTAPTHPGTTNVNPNPAGNPPPPPTPPVAKVLKVGSTINAKKLFDLYSDGSLTPALDDDGNQITVSNGSYLGTVTSIGGTIGIENYDIPNTDATQFYIVASPSQYSITN